MQVYDISRKALRDLESRGIFWDDGARGRGDYLVVICLARFAKSPSRIRILERFEDEYPAMFRACACQGVALHNAQWSDSHYVCCYEVWHIVVDEDQQPKHDTEHVNECGKKPSRHVFVKFDEKEPETVTPPELPKEDLEELDRIFPPVETITDTLPRSVWSMYAETYNVLGVYDVPSTLDVLVQMDDNTNGKNCLRFACDGVKLRRVGLYPRANLIEYSWTVDKLADFVKLAAFIQKMSGYGCSVSLMTTKGRDE